MCIRDRYFIWLQGESDALAHTSGDEYICRMVRLKNALKHDIGIDRFAIIKVGWFAKLLDPTDIYDKAIMDAQEALPQLDRDFIIATDICPDLSLDSRYMNPYAIGHYNNAGMRIIGESGADGLVRAEFGILTGAR